MGMVVTCLLSLSLWAANPVYITVRGKVTSGGKAVGGVPVTDGVSTVVTDKKGRYTLNTTSDRPFVYYSLPSGYRSPVVNGVPVFYAAIDPADPKQTRNFELHKAPGSQENHAFVVWADPQVLDSSELILLKEVTKDVQKTIEDLARTVPVHAIGAGDIVFDRLHLFTPYKEITATTGVPFYQAIGNHDMDYNKRSDERSTRSYYSHFGPAYYSYNVGKVHYITLKSVFYYGDSYQYMGYLDENQLRWLEHDLAQVAKGSTVVVTMHIPSTYGDSPRGEYGSRMRNSVMNKHELYRILAPYNVHIMAGHSHNQWNMVIAPNILEHMHAAASGAWWQGEVATDGTPKGYTVYEVSGDSLTWYFKGVNASREEQLKVYPAGADTLHPGHIIANVYNYDPLWKVWWYENDQRMGEMERYWGVDPLAGQLYQPGKNKKHSWLSAGPTYHLFRAKVKDPKAVVSIVVQDRFGNTYKKTLQPQGSPVF